MIVSILAWLGSGALCAAPFFIDTASGKLLAVFGLSILIPQTIQKKAYNLTLLNCVGIVGYLWELFN